MLGNWLYSAYTDLGLLVLRVSFGLMLLVLHGWGKVQGFSEMFHSFGDPIGVGSELSYLMATGAEFVCTLMVVFGLLTRLATIPILILFGVIFCVVMADKPFAGKEFIVMYFMAYLTIFLAGPGKYSVDHKWLRKRA